MIIVCCILSLTVAILLLLWMVRLSKADPFPKGKIFFMLAWGAWVATVIGVFLLSLDYLPYLFRVGLVQFWTDFWADDQTAFNEGTELFRGEKITLFRIFYDAFLTAAIPEEIGKYLVARDFIYKQKLASKNPVFNSIMCCAFVALGFKLIEDVFYINGDVFTAILRGILPLHFTVQIIMGFFIGKAITTGKKFNHFWALFIPIMIHGIYDAVIFALDISNWFLLLYFLIYFSILGLTFVLLILLTIESRKIGRKNNEQRFDQNI